MRSPPDTVFFLSDYGTRDEFAGVVRAVLRRLAPRCVVVDLVHDVAPFDVIAGARALERAVPHLGAGVVLGIVDPGVGSGRRGVAMGCDGPAEPGYFVGPDNGLLVGAAEQAGGPIRAVELGVEGDHRASTFDGRDVFAPAVAALCNGADLETLGPAIEPRSLVRLDQSHPTSARLADGRSVLWCEITWVDRFGNAQLNVPANHLDPGSSVVLVRPAGDGPRPQEEVVARRVVAFADLGEQELGMIADANGRLALAVHRGSAARRLDLRPGDVVGIGSPRR